MPVPKLLGRQRGLSPGIEAVEAGGRGWGLSALGTHGAKPQAFRHVGSDVACC